MSVTLKEVYNNSKIIENTFYKNGLIKIKNITFKGLFSDIGKKIKKENKTSVDLVREIREI